MLFIRKSLVTVLLLFQLKAFNQTSPPFQELKAFAAQKILVRATVVLI